LEKERGAHRLREAIASAFAAELLMPQREILRILKEDMSAPNRIEISHLKDLKGRFEVSEWAMLRRLHETGVIDDGRYVQLSGRAIPSISQ
jgi:Zn-dependent peptidase ImmA (M78 family)